MTLAEMFECLRYAAIAFGVEVTAETAAVYLDQLGGYESAVIVAAVRRAVARGDRFPTVKAIRDEIREVEDKRRDPVVASNMRIAARVAECRRLGFQPDEIDAEIVKLEGKLSVRRLGG